MKFRCEVGKGKGSAWPDVHRTMNRAKIMFPDGQDLGEINADVGMLKS